MSLLSFTSAFPNNFANVKVQLLLVRFCNPFHTVRYVFVKLSNFLVAIFVPKSKQMIEGFSLANKPIDWV